MTPRHYRAPAATPATTPSGLAPPSPAAASTSPLRTIASSELLAGQACILIAHAGQHYRLQTTRQGKLILTK
ncbi:MAG: hemin uptake protein HemP [Rhodoferax sp.]